MKNVLIEYFGSIYYTILPCYSSIYLSPNIFLQSKIITTYYFNSYSYHRLIKCLIVANILFLKLYLLTVVRIPLMFYCCLLDFYVPVATPLLHNLDIVNKVSVDMSI